MLKYAINFEDDEGTFFGQLSRFARGGNFRRNPQGRNPLRQRRDRGNNLRPFCTWEDIPRQVATGEAMVRVAFDLNSEYGLNGC